MEKTKNEYVRDVCNLLDMGREYPVGLYGYPIKEIEKCYRDGLTVSQAYARIV